MPAPANADLSNESDTLPMRITWSVTPSRSAWALTVET